VSIIDRTEHPYDVLGGLRVCLDDGHPDYRKRGGVKMQVRRSTVGFASRPTIQKAMTDACLTEVG
jgi:hypothetical protein